MAGRASIEVREPIPGLKRAGRLFRDYYGFDIVMPANFRAVEIVLKSYFDPWRMSGVRGKAFRPAKNSVYTNPAKVSMLVPCHELGKMPLQHKNLEHRNNFFAKKRQLFSGISRAYPLKTPCAWWWARPCSGGRGRTSGQSRFAPCEARQVVRHLIEARAETSSVRELLWLLFTGISNVCYKMQQKASNSPASKRRQGS